MSKKNTLTDIGIGILTGLEALNNAEDEKSKGVKEKNSIYVEELKSTTINSEKSESVEEYNSNIVKVEKHKRSFMLSNIQIEMIYKLKYKFINKDLSEIVGEAIEEYYCKRTKE